MSEEDEFEETYRRLIRDRIDLLKSAKPLFNQYVKVSKDIKRKEEIQKQYIQRLNEILKFAGVHVYFEGDIEKVITNFNLEIKKLQDLIPHIDKDKFQHLQLEEESDL